METTMKLVKGLSVCLLLLCFASGSAADPKAGSAKKKIFVVSSYHREYAWPQMTNKGFCEALLKFGYFDTREQIEEFSRTDAIETSRIVMKKMWLDAKRKSKKSEIDIMSSRIYQAIREFKPDLLFLGDDEAVDSLGRRFLDTGMPVVFWGMNNTPIKYGLVDSQEKPGHNITGVYQSGYYAESLQLLKKLVPRAKTFAILSDDTATGRSHYKAIEYLAQQGALPLRLVETVATTDYEMWKKKATELQKKVDVFFIAAFAALKDTDGNYVPTPEVASWYVNHITIPEAVEMRHFVGMGMLCGADDSAYNQGYEAVVIGHDIFSKRANPATYPPRAPKRGALMVNTKRAKALGISLSPEIGIEEYIDGDKY